MRAWIILILAGPATLAQDDPHFPPARENERRRAADGVGKRGDPRQDIVQVCVLWLQCIEKEFAFSTLARLMLPLKEGAESPDQEE